ncbi:MAG: rhamnulokinase [Clostridiales bacterium]|nr:rhamnulokinase [Clostridiales bacterium]
MVKKYLAFDFGASSGRAILGTLNSGKLEMTEIHRFLNEPVMLNGRFTWDLPRLYHEVLLALKKAAAQGGVDAIGIDTWGVDYGLIDKNGHLLGDPVNYRDARTDGMMDKAFSVVPKAEIYEKTGLAFLQFNTLYQLYSSVLEDDPLLKAADKLLFMPDLFAYLLTGVAGTEYTIASTSQMIDPNTRKWATDIIEKLGIPASILGDITEPGTVRGVLSKAVQDETGLGAVPVIAIAGHDTASAVAAVPAEGSDFAYISSGTWSLLGGESKTPVINEEAAKANFTNEGGVFDTIRVLKNIMGLWIIQECKRYWDANGEEYSFAELVKLAEKEPAFRAFFDPDDDAFLAPHQMPKRICDYIEKSGQTAPNTIGGITRVVYESLALKYRYCIECYEKFTGKKVHALHIVGGGSNNALLNKFTANALNIPVYAGPGEATAIGNLLMQAYAMGEVKDIADLRKIVADSFPIVKVEPDKDRAAWDEAYAKFTAMFELK